MAITDFSNSLNYGPSSLLQAAPAPNVMSGFQAPDAFGGMRGSAGVPSELGAWDTFKKGFSEINWLDSTTDGVKQLGALGQFGDIGKSLFNGWLGMKQYGLAKDSLAFNKESYYKNYDAQKRTTNANLEDRQAARVASNAGAYESVGSYMDKNRIA